MLDHQKICFIYRASEKSEEILEHLKSLVFPIEMIPEYIKIEPSKSLAKSYNKAMQSSNAKYKVYMDAGVTINNKYFIVDMIKLFDINNEIGIFGVIGEKQVNLDGNIYYQNNKFGIIYERDSKENRIIEYKNSNEIYESVQILDKRILVTTQDLVWCDDYEDDNYAVAATCIEYIRSGYKVVVPKQDKPWCSSDIREDASRDLNREDSFRFIGKYFEYLFPLVSILIPAYNQTKYLKIAIESAIRQTYKNIEIIVGDDSTTNDVEDFIRPYLMEYSNISYFKNEIRANDYGLTNAVNCFKRSNGFYVNFLYHDDIFEETKVERMMEYILRDQSIALVTSFRQPIDSEGNIKISDGAFKKLTEHDEIIDGKLISKYMLITMTNFIGEPTTVLFNKKYLRSNDIFTYGGLKFYSLVDVALWMALLENGKAVYIADTLSYFRVHGEQNSNRSEIILKNYEDWITLVNMAARRGIFLDNMEYKKSLCNIMINTLAYIRDIESFEKTDYFGLKNEFLNSTEILFGSNKA